MKRKLILIVLSGALLVNCSKDKNDAPPAAPDLRKGLLAYFEFNTNSLYDSTNKVMDVSKTAGVLQTIDRNFNLSAILCKDASLTAQSLNWKPFPLTITMWVLPADSTAQKYFMLSNDGVIGFVQDGKKMGFVVSHPATAAALAMTAPGKKWVHITGTFDGKTIRTYINGELKATKDHPGEAESIVWFRLAMANNVYWNGALDDMRVYDRVLSDEEILMIAK